MITKKCNKCKSEKVLAEFNKCKSNKDGLSYICKHCQRKLSKKWCAIPKVKKQREEYRNRPEVKEYMKNRNQTIAGIFTHIKQGAERRGINLNFTSAELGIWYNEQTKTCHYCNVTPENLIGENKYGKTNRLTIDRKDNNKGYDLDNLVLACYRCNATKSNYFTEQEMLLIGKIIQNKRNEDDI